MRKLLHFWILTAVTSLSFSASSIAEQQPWSLEQRTPYNMKEQERKHLEHHPLTRAAKPWKICALIPHLKDAYWIGIDYGLMQQASALNINLDLFEANSYYGITRQLSQLEHCVQADYDAILLGAVDPDILARYPKMVNKPIIALVNKLNSPRVYTRIGVNWYQMGMMAGNFIKQDSHTPAKIALLTGPQKVGGSDWVEQGIKAAIKASQAKIMAIRHADNNRNLHRKQLQLQLKEQVPDYIVGSAVAIEAAISVLKQKHLEHKVKLVSTYLSPATLRALYRGKVLYSNDDQVVLQGKLAIDIVIRELEGAEPFGDIGPSILGFDAHAPQQEKLQDSLAPAAFYPLYSVSAKPKG